MTLELGDQYNILCKVIDENGAIDQFGVEAGLQNQVLTCDYNFPNVFAFKDAVSSVSATPSANITIGGTASAPTIGLSSPCDATIDLGTQSIIGSSSQLIFEIGDFNTTLQAGLIINNNLVGGGGCALTNLQLEISDQSGEVAATLNRDELVFFNQTQGDEFTATLTNKSLTLADNAVPATDIAVLENNKLTLTSSVASTALPMLELVSTSVVAGTTIGTPTIKTQEMKNAQTGDIIMSQQFFSKNFNGDNKQFGGIECRATSSISGDTDGSLDFYNMVNGNSIRTFTMNGNDNENNSFRPLDLNGNTLKTSTASLTLNATQSNGPGFINLQTKNGTGGLSISGDKTESPTAGGSANKFLVITLNGVAHKIALLNV